MTASKTKRELTCIDDGIALIPSGIRATFRKRVRTVLQSRIFLRLGYSEVSLSIVRDAKIRRLNREFRGKDKPTDVLSFTHDAEDTPVAVRSPSIGDVVISIDTAKRQAKEFEVSLLDELTRLFIHGMLHCAGFDHEGVPRKTAVKMFRTQSYLLSRLKGPKK